MMRARMLVGAMVAAGIAAPAGAADLLPPVLNDYPTEARAEYVFACMATNGQTRDALVRCSCSIDQIAAILPYDAYVAAETVLTLRQTSGERSTLFRGTAATTAVVAELRRAQAEAEILCF